MTITVWQLRLELWFYNYELITQVMRKQQVKAWFPLLLLLSLAFERIFIFCDTTVLLHLHLINIKLCVHKLSLTHKHHHDNKDNLPGTQTLTFTSLRLYPCQPIILPEPWHSHYYVPYNRYKHCVVKVTQNKSCVWHVFRAAIY